jgi:hypothetical protein
MMMLWKRFDLSSLVLGWVVYSIYMNRYTDIQENIYKST